MSQAILGTLRGADEVDMGDLEFIQGKVTTGNYFQVSGDIDTLASTIEFIVPNSKTAFMIEAKITPTTHTNPAVAGAGTTVSVKNAVQAELKLDGTTKDTANVGFTSQASTPGTAAGSGHASGQNINSDFFNVLGLSLVGDGIKVIEIENTLDDGTAFATFSGYLIDT